MPVRDITVSWMTISRSVPSYMRPPMLEYSPSVFSRTISMSISPAFSGCPSRPTSGERTPGISLAGRRFTYWSNSRRKRSNDPHSETWSGIFCGQPTAPKKIASLRCSCSFQSSGSILPWRSKNSQLAKPCCSISRPMPKRLAAASSTRSPSGITSLPMPSPAITAIRYVVMLCLAPCHRRSRASLT